MNQWDGRFHQMGLDTDGWHLFQFCATLEQLRARLTNHLHLADITGPIVSWCAETLGPEGIRWRGGLSRLAFRTEADAMLFKLRWC